MTDISAVVSQGGAAVTGTVGTASAQSVVAAVGRQTRVSAAVSAAGRTVEATVGAIATVISAVVAGAPQSAPPQDSWFGAW